MVGIGFPSRGGAFHINRYLRRKRFKMPLMHG